MTDLGADRWAYPCFSLGRCYSERAFLHFYPYTSHIIEKERERAKREREREVDNEGHRERERDQRVRESEREEGRGGVWDIESEGARERERERTGEILHTQTIIKTWLHVYTVGTRCLSINIIIHNYFTHVQVIFITVKLSFFFYITILDALANAAL